MQLRLARRLAVRVEARIVRARASGLVRTQCWLWQGARVGGRLRYGCLRDGDRHQYAHRIMYRAHVGPIPRGLVLDHLCEVPWCVRPSHLEAVTQSENIRRGFRRAR